MNKKHSSEKEKGFSRIRELKKKINDEKYLNYAISKMATEICEVFFK